MNLWIKWMSKALEEDHVFFPFLFVFFFFATSPAPRPPFSFRIHSGKKSNTNLIVTPQEVQEVTVSANGLVILNYFFGKVSVKFRFFFFSLRHQNQVLTAFFPRGIHLLCIDVI